MADPGHGRLGVHVDPREALRRDRPKVSMIGSPISRSGAIVALALLLAADAGGVDGQQRPAAEGLRGRRERRWGQEPDRSR